MSMSKKDFIALVDCIKDHNSYGIEPFTESQINTIMSFCRGQNYNFLEGRFLGYLRGECTGHGGKIKQPKQPKPRQASAPVVCDDCLGVDGHEAHCYAQAVAKG